jgi:hypothetical protein
VNSKEIDNDSIEYHLKNNQEAAKNYYLAIDPGEKKTGWATFDKSGNTLTGNGIISGGLAEVGTFLFVDLEPLPRVVICETYRVKDFQHKHHFEKIPTIRIIGLIEWYAITHGCEFIEQESTVYRTGMKWGGLHVPSGHVNDNRSAIGHGIFYLHKKKRLWKIR